MIRSESVHMIREKAIDGKTAYTIAKELGISKNTAKKYIAPGSTEKAQYPKRQSKIDAFKPEIDKLIACGVYNCVVILERIQKLGYDGKITILKDYVRPFRPAKKCRAVRRYETEPGYQAQMDWAICPYIGTDGKEHKLTAFTMILGHSRMRYLEFSKRCDVFSLMHCMLNAFEYFGGIPETVLTDNMKTVTLGREAGKPIMNQKMLEFANDMGFVWKLCKIRRPQTKGKVERLVNYVKDNFMAARTFTDINDINAQAKDWCNKVNAKASATTNDTAVKGLTQEKLKPLPTAAIRDRYRYESRSVSKDGFISYDGVRYGVPWEYSGRYVTVRVKNGRLEIFYELMLIAKHNIEGVSGRTVMLEGQYKGLTEKNGLIYPISARQVSSQVETRPLSVYERILEASNG